MANACGLHDVGINSRKECLRFACMIRRRRMSMRQAGWKPVSRIDALSIRDSRAECPFQYRGSTKYHDKADMYLLK